MTQPVVFFGTHTFAETVLQGLIESPFIAVEQVITQPDRPVGRTQELQVSPVKKLAQKHNIPVEQPASLKRYTISTNVDLFVVAQYGLLIPKHILDTPAKGILNVHTSLLPKYRGASPIQSALIHGETETGVTIMKMDIGMDTGPVLLQKTLPIDPDDTYATLDAKMAVTGTQALLEVIPLYVDGSLHPQQQDDAQATTCSQLTREDGKIDWQNTSKNLYNQYRGMTPWPGVWTMWNGKRLKLLRIRPGIPQLKPGAVSLAHGTMHIGTQDGSLEILELQLEGKRAMDSATFINGFASIDGHILG